MKIEQNNYYKNNMNETIKQIMLDQIEELELKLASAHEQIMRLEKAGDGLVAGAGAVNMWERIKVWDTTKENKAINNMKRYPKDSYTNPDFDMNKIKLTYKATYIDGGTNIYIGSDGKSYYEDYRLQTKTKGALYNDYPDHSSAKILNWGDLNYLVEWNDIAYKWQGRCPYYHSYHHPTTEHFRDLMNGVVVGNIFEHNNLLEK